MLRGVVAVGAVVAVLLGWSSDVWAQLFGPKATVTAPEGKGIEEAQQEADNGPKARLAVARFTDKTGKGWWTGAIGDGMADMLATALFHTNRYIVLERQTLGDVLKEPDLAAAGRIKRGTEAPTGEIEGAELLITGAVTEFEGAQSGIGGGIGGIGGIGGRILGGIAGGLKKAHMAIDVRVIDTKIVTAGTALALMAAVEERSRGGDAAAVEAAARRVVDGLRLLFALGTLDYLVKGGRAGKAQGLAANILNIKPVLTFNKDGIIEPFKKVRGTKTALAEIAAQVAADSSSRPVRLALFHSTSPGLADELRAALDAAGARYELVLTGRVGAVIGTYAGPGAVGAAYYPEQ